MLIVLENKEYEDVIGNSSAPFINMLAGDYGLATASYGMRHPSLPNYLALVSGSSHGITDDCTECSVDGKNLAMQLTEAGVGWKAYMEGMPSSCFDGASSSQGYEKKHNPFMYFSEFLQNSSGCEQIVPFEELAGDLADGNAPPFLWVTPNSCHSGHDCAINAADAWLATFIPSVQSSSWFDSEARIIVTWDEGRTDAGCCQGAAGGHIVTLVIGKGITPGSRLTQAVDTAGLLRTVEDLYGLAYLGDAGCSCSGDLHALMGLGGSGDTPRSSPGPAEDSLQFSPSDDTYIQEDKPARNFGGETSLQVDQSPVKHILIRFVVSGTAGRSIKKATLRLYAVNASDTGGVISQIGTQGSAWNQASVTWSNAPASTSGTVASLGRVTVGQWYNVDLTPTIHGDGSFNFLITSPSNDGADYASSEDGSGNGPQLIVALQ
jgi:phosphatidylinositol-3-phosphatase